MADSLLGPPLILVFVRAGQFAPAFYIVSMPLNIQLCIGCSIKVIHLPILSVPLKVWVS